MRTNSMVCHHGANARIRKRVALISCGICASVVKLNPSYNVRRIRTSNQAEHAIMEDVVIVSAVRTPIGKFQGSLSDLSAPQLGAIVVREAVRRASIDPNSVDECILGNVISAGLGQNPARQAALKG